MEDLLKGILIPIKDVQNLRGIAMPIGLEYLQLVVTGPPGAGKSYYINQIRGWPNEGYIDLSRKRWWKDQTLMYRPREVHLGIPFKDFTEPLTVFDKEWVEATESLQIDFARIKIPPRNDGVLRTNWIGRYIFEFILPDPDLVLEQRQNRKNEGYFPVDADLSREIVVRQLQTYQQIALYMHRAGMQVYIRKGLEGKPMRISEKGAARVPRWSIISKPPRPSLKSLAGWKQLLGLDKSTWFTLSDTLEEIKGVSIVAHDGKMFEMHLNDYVLSFYPEFPLGVKRKAIQKNWIITTADMCSTEKPTGFARLKVGETVILGRSNRLYHTIFNFTKDVGQRHVAVTNKRGDLTLTPLDGEKRVALVRPDDLDYRKRVDAKRQNAFLQLKKLYGGSIQHKSLKEALQLLKQTNQLLQQEPMRPKNNAGKAGGILHLEKETTPVIIGDLHGRVDNLLKILSENCLLSYLQKKKTTVVILGDAFHSEIAGEMEDMEESILMIDLLCTLKCSFPENFFYLRGNHDSFADDISKNGISQGVLMREQLYELRGDAYVAEMEKFFNNLSYIVTSSYFYGCHAAPPRSEVTYEDLVNIHSNPGLINEVTKNRIQTPSYLSGYNKTDSKRFRKTLGIAKNIPFVVGHTPLDPFGSVWKNVGGIKNHYIIYSAHIEGPTILQYINGKLIPLSFPAEPITKLANNL